jgi:cell division protein FtsW
MASVAAVASRLRRATSAPAKPAPLEHSMLVTAVLCLIAGGAVMVYSAAAPSALGGGSATGQLIRFGGYALLGLVVMRAASRIGLDLVRRFTGPLLAISFAMLVAVRLPGLGHSSNTTAQRWLGVGPLQFEPSELAKLALVLYGAHVFSSGRPSARQVKRAFKRLFLVGGTGCLLVATEPDLGTTLVIAVAMIAITVAAGVPRRQLALAGAVCVVLVGGFALAEPYAVDRLTSFVNPSAHASTTGFQAVQSEIAIGSGGVFGRGPGASVQKDNYLPEASTDFILAVVGEELGFVGILALLLFYGLIALAGLRAARHATGSYAMLVAVGTTSVIVFQATLNAFAVLGIAPVTGVPLPFVSYGASNLLVMLAAMGLLLNVARGGSAHLRAVRSARERESAHADRDRSRRYGRARGAGARRRGRAAGAGG